MLKQLATITLFFISLSMIAQDRENTSIYLENEFVKVEEFEGQCTSDPLPDYEAIYFKVTNKTNKQLKLSWEHQVYRNGVCNTCTREYFYTLELKPNEIVEGGCGSTYNRKLKIFNDYIAEYMKNPKQVVTKFEWANFKTECLNCNKE